MEAKNHLKKTEKNIVDNVLFKVQEFQSTGELKLPKDYSVENALKSAYLILSETVDKDEKPVLESCTNVSIANSLLSMVTQGLSPMKKQCYFIAYGGKLQLSRSYQGSIAIARRVGLKSIVSNVIYEKDDFSYEIDAETGLTKILKHKQNLENIDLSKIRGAYALTTMENGTKELTVMNIVQIKKAWAQGYAKGSSGAHTNFTDEMCKKTVINRACKSIISSSTDGYLFDKTEDQDQDQSTVVPKNANSEIIDIESTEVVETKKDSSTEVSSTEDSGQEVSVKEHKEPMLVPEF